MIAASILLPFLSNLVDGRNTTIFCSIIKIAKHAVSMLNDDRIGTMVPGDSKALSNRLWFFLCLRLAFQ